MNTTRIPRTQRCPNPQNSSKCMGLLVTKSPRTDVLCPNCRTLGRQLSENRRRMRNRIARITTPATIQTQEFQRAEHALLFDEPEVRAPQNVHTVSANVDSSCNHCTHYTACQLRVHNGLWVACEIPDYVDALHLRTVGNVQAIISPEIINTLLQYQLPTQQYQEQPG